MGYPNRILRSSLGPRLRDTVTPESQETDIGCAQFEALFRQVTGMNLALAARAVLIAKWNTGSAQFDISYRAEAWNPDNDLAHPVLARTSAGVYTYTFLATYADENSQTVATQLLAARLSSLKPLTAFADRVDAHAWVDATNPLQVNLRLWNGATGTPEDVAFWLEVV